MTATTLYNRLLALFPKEPVYSGVVEAEHSDGTATVVIHGGLKARVLNPTGENQNEAVYVQDGKIIGKAPALPLHSIEI